VTLFWRCREKETRGMASANSALERGKKRRGPHITCSPWKRGSDVSIQSGGGKKGKENPCDLRRKEQGGKISFLLWGEKTRALKLRGEGEGGGNVSSRKGG